MNVEKMMLSWIGVSLRLCVMLVLVIDIVVWFV